MQRPWLDSYPANVPHEISESTQKFSDRPSFTNMGKTITFAELDELTLAFAAWIKNETTLEKGDRIAVMMPNLLQYPVIVFGALRAGLVVVNTNPLYTARELEHQLTDSGAKAIVVVEAFASTLAEIAEHTQLETIITTRFGDMLGFPKGMLVNFVIRKIKKMVKPYSLPGSHSFKSIVTTKARAEDVDADLNLDDIAFLQYTGGTTGVAKGAMLTHRNMVSNAMQALAWIDAVEIDEGKEIIVTALPLIPAFVKDLSKYPFTALTGVNTLFNALLNNDKFRSLDFSPLKLVLGGGMAVQESVAKEWKDVTGITGLPLPSTDFCIMSTDNELVAQGEEGELCVRGPQVMKGYWQKQEATDKTIDKDGWLHTGDVAIMDEKGYFKIVDRLKDMILVSGFNVYPNEIESVVSQMPEVLEVGAIGIPDDHSGETVKVVITRKDPSLTVEQVMAHCKKNLTGYKRPSVVQFVEELPKTNVGKILRRELREIK